jgi:flagellar M-ring protein FliF
MPFQEVAATDMVAAPGMMQQMIERYFWSGLQALLLGLVVIVLAFGVVRPMLSPKGKTEALTGTAAKGAGGATAAAGAAPESDPFNYLKDYAKERQDETAALLQQWLNEDQKVAVNE